MAPLEVPKSVLSSDWFTQGTRIKAATPFKLTFKDIMKTNSGSCELLRFRV